MPPYRVYTFLAPSLLSLYQRVVDDLARRLGCPLELYVGQTYDEVPRADFSFICGLPYVLRTPPHQPAASLIALAAPILRGERYGGRPIYFSDVIVRQDRPWRSFADLAGCSWAYNEPESQSGYGITRYHLVLMGCTGGFFGPVIEAGFHQTAIRLVADGAIDAAAIDSHVLAIEARDHPDLIARLRVIDTLGPSTIQPFTAAAHIPPALRADVRSVLAEMHLDDSLRAAFDHALIERFTPLDDSAYDDIRAMLAACQRASFLTLK